MLATRDTAQVLGSAKDDPSSDDKPPYFDVSARLLSTNKEMSDVNKNALYMR